VTGRGEEADKYLHNRTHQMARAMRTAKEFPTMIFGCSDEIGKSAGRQAAGGLQQLKMDRADSSEHDCGIGFLVGILSMKM
jgi:hypothetical protein